ncbi:hypothetical protein ABIB57_002541 [Devosia sp. UYZn731]|uniref:DUF3828 domain-containing protein n=1 Tax=Devosia sp. UYZn731 TaxID=3156345 RepID=UPI0033961A64
MRLAVLAAGFVLAFTGIVAAQPYDTPDALLQAFYARYLAADTDFSDEGEFRSAGLQALYDADAQATPEGDSGALDFDPFIDGQDWQITDLQIGAAGIAGDYASADVSFKNFGEERTLSYDLVKEDGGWKIDDVESKTPGNEYRLSEIFTLAHAD